jgi:hypothetical protein
LLDFFPEWTLIAVLALIVVGLVIAALVERFGRRNKDDPDDRAE